MQDKKPKVTFQLTTFGNLEDSEKEKVEGNLEGITEESMIIKEYRSSSFVKLKRFVPQNNLLTSQIKKVLGDGQREMITNHINKSLIF